MEAVDRTPRLVRRARALAGELGFGKACSDAVGALLRTLAAAVDGTVLELGTGCGVGSAWILEGLRPGSSLVSIDSDPRLHAAVRTTFSGVHAAEFLCGDWREALERGPFALAFVDVGDAKDAGADAVIASLRPGGLVVLDDFTPGPLYLGSHDDRWHRWMEHPDLASCEILGEPGAAVIVAARRD